MWIIPIGGLDIKGLLHSAKKMDFIKMTVKMMQESEEDMSVQSERVRHAHIGVGLVIHFSHSWAARSILTASYWTWKTSR